MLSLKRYEGQAIFIDDDIQVRVVEIGDGEVRIGIIAPPAVRVVRHEVRVRKQRKEKSK